MAYGYFFIPNDPRDIASINFDRSETTRIGKYLFKHSLMLSFMLPGLILVFTSCVIEYFQATIVIGCYAVMG